MFEKALSVDRKKLMWALAIVGINSLFVSGVLQLILNVVIFLLAIWILLVARSERPEGHH